MDPETKKILKEWRENMEQAQAMEFTLVAEEQYKNAQDFRKVIDEADAYWKEYFKNKKDNSLEQGSRPALNLTP